MLRAETGKGRVDRAGAQHLFLFPSTPYLCETPMEQASIQTSIFLPRETSVLGVVIACVLFHVFPKLSILSRIPRKTPPKMHTRGQA